LAGEDDRPGAMETKVETVLGVWLESLVKTNKIRGVSESRQTCLALRMERTRRMQGCVEVGCTRVGRDARPACDEQE